MTEKIQAFFASKKTQALSLLLGLLSLALALVCFLAPLGRERWAIQSLGETTVNQLSPLSMSMTHYEPQRLRYLLATETTGPTYDKLIDLLSQAKEEYGFARLYLVYEKKDASLACLADADYEENSDFLPGVPYEQGYIDGDCVSKVKELLVGRGDSDYIGEIYNGDLVLAFAPLTDTQSGEVLAVLCADARLTYTNFSEFYGVELSRVAEALAAVFIVCFVVFFIGRSFDGVEDSKNGKNDKTNGRWFNKPTVTQQENNVYIDPLDDVDPNDYL
ncbi:MAG: hypothetical protein IJ411_03065 [Oscillospiraceae bacterium]|nr:hypothetical protein [Oscillospiraceae bacterium]